MMYETMYDILRDWQVHKVLLLSLLIFGPDALICAYLALHFAYYEYNKKVSKVSAGLAVVALVLMFAVGAAMQFYPDTGTAKALVEELAIRKGIDAAPYIKILEQ